MKKMFEYKSHSCFKGSEVTVCVCVSVCVCVCERERERERKREREGGREIGSE